MVDLLGSLASAFLQVLLDRMARPELIEFFRRNHIDMSLLEKLKMLLLVAVTVLNDAEEKRFIEPSLKEWFDGLQNAAYSADDLLDEIATKVREEDNKTTKDEVTDFVSSLNPLVEGLRSKLHRIFEMLKFMVENKDHLGLKEGGVGKSLSLPSTTTSLVDDHVYGRDHDSEKMINILLSGDSNGEGVSVVAIVGMGGIGKTTFAQILFNDERVRNHFQSRSWASISETSSVCEITKKVLESFTLKCSNTTDLNALQIKLRDRLARQKFLLIMDGFWNENFLDWDILRRPFLWGGRGSKIIITTRSQSAAKAIQADLVHLLPPLSDGDTQRLFAHHAFKTGNPAEYPVLAEIGKKIVEKCKGLPLAAKTLGNLLRYKEDAEEWESISNSKIWELPSHKSSILPALRLSYIHLSSLLKRCFAYCSVFPKSYEIEKWDLIYLWMAEGILPQTETEKLMEDVGDECFQDLLSRSFFHQSTRNKSRFMMHDLINDLAQYVAGDFCYNLVDNDPRKIRNWARHVSYSHGKYDAPDKFVSFTECKQLRTILSFTSPTSSSNSAFTSMVSQFLEKQNPLRVLSLSNYHIAEFPVSIGNSLHLRYLNLSDTMINCLPDFVCKCPNLETLILSCCHNLTQLPKGIVKLANLRHLDISNSTRVTEMPTKFGRLKSLQVLTTFVVSSAGRCRISELGELSELRGALLIDNLQNLTDETEASNAGLSSKKYLHELVFRWKTRTHDVESETKVLDRLEPHQNLKRIKIQNFGGHTLPNWLGSSEFSRMVVLRLVGCKNCLSVPSLGQLPSLKEIYITEMESLHMVNEDMEGNKCLEIITIRNCASLTTICRNGLPSTLRSLEIYKCRNLQLFDATGLMHYYPALTRLHLKSCCDSLTSFPLSCFTNLEELHVQDCRNLTEIAFSPNSLPYLRKLELKDCSELGSFPEGGFPAPKLESLSIIKCAKLSPELAWGLQEMTSLTSLYISGLPFLTSLEHTGASIKTLEIKDCNNLASLPLERLVHSLSHLTIRACPTIKQLCQSQGVCWSLISRIPSRVIED